MAISDKQRLQQALGLKNFITDVELQRTTTGVNIIFEINGNLKYTDHIRKEKLYQIQGADFVLFQQNPPHLETLHFLKKHFSMLMDLVIKLELSNLYYKDEVMIRSSSKKDNNSWEIDNFTIIRMKKFTKKI